MTLAVGGDQEKVLTARFDALFLIDSKIDFQIYGEIVFTALIGVFGIALVTDVFCDVHFTSCSWIE